MAQTDNNLPKAGRDPPETATLHCSLCGECVTNLFPRRNYHVVVCHLQKNLYHCPYCDRSVAIWWNNLKTHICRRHPGRKMEILSTAEHLEPAIDKLRRECFNKPLGRRFGGVQAEGKVEITELSEEEVTARRMEAAMAMADDDQDLSDSGKELAPDDDIQCRQSEMTPGGKQSFPNTAPLPSTSQQKRRSHFWTKKKKHRKLRALKIESNKSRSASISSANQSRSASIDKSSDSRVDKSSLVGTNLTIDPSELRRLYKQKRAKENKSEDSSGHSEHSSKIEQQAGKAESDPVSEKKPSDRPAKGKFNGVSAVPKHDFGGLQTVETQPKRNKIRRTVGKKLSKRKNNPKKPKIDTQSNISTPKSWRRARPDPTSSVVSLSKKEFRETKLSKANELKQRRQQSKECGVCGQSLKNKNDELKHILAEHLQKPVFFCPYCPEGNSIASKSEVEYHVMVDHPGETVQIRTEVELHKDEIDSWTTKCFSSANKSGNTVLSLSERVELLKDYETKFLSREELCRKYQISRRTFFNILRCKKKYNVVGSCSNSAEKKKHLTMDAAFDAKLRKLCKSKIQREKNEPLSAKSILKKAEEIASEIGFNLELRAPDLWVKNWSRKNAVPIIFGVENHILG